MGSVRQNRLAGWRHSHWGQDAGAVSAPGGGMPREAPVRRPGAAPGPAPPRVARAALAHVAVLAGVIWLADRTALPEPPPAASVFTMVFASPKASALHATMQPRPNPTTPPPPAQLAATSPEPAPALPPTPAQPPAPSQAQPETTHATASNPSPAEAAVPAPPPPAAQPAIPHPEAQKPPAIEAALPAPPPLPPTAEPEAQRHPPTPPVPPVRAAETSAEAALPLPPPPAPAAPPVRLPRTAAPVQPIGPTPAPAAMAAASPVSISAHIPARPVTVLAKDPPPRYPELARRRGEQGRVVLLVRVGPNGLPVAVTIDRTSGYASLDHAALDAVRQWRFAPAVEDGRPVAALAEVPVQFRLSD